MSTAVSAQSLSFQARTEVATIDAPRAIAATDVTGDGWVDLIVAGTGRGSVTVYPSHGAEDGDEGQRFRPARDYVLGGGPFDLALGDLNRDGHLDIAVANADSDTINILVNSGAGLFPTRVDLPMRRRSEADHGARRAGELLRDGASSPIRRRSTNCGSG